MTSRGPRAIGDVDAEDKESTYAVRLAIAHLAFRQVDDGGGHRSSSETLNSVNAEGAVCRPFLFCYHHSVAQSRFSHMITLAEAIKTGRMAEFAAQEEARGVGPIERGAFGSLLGKAVKPPQSEDQLLEQTPETFDAIGVCSAPWR
jgi:hypothetical protein